MRRVRDDQSAKTYCGETVVGDLRLGDALGSLFLIKAW